MITMPGQKMNFYVWSGTKGAEVKAFYSWDSDAKTKIARWIQSHGEDAGEIHYIGKESRKPGGIVV